MKKRIISLIMVVVLSFSLTQNIFAVEQNDDAISFVSNHLTSIFNSLIDVEDFNLQNTDPNNLYIGNPIMFYANENGHTSYASLYPLIYNDLSKPSVLGFSRIIENDSGERTIDYCTNPAPEVNEFISEYGNTPFCIIRYDDYTKVLGQDTPELNILLASETTVDLDGLYFGDLEFSLITPKVKLSLPTHGTSIYAVQHNSLNVPDIRQKGKYTCWAACIASIVDYHYGYSLDSTNIVVKAANAGIITTGDKGATLTEAKQVLDLYGGRNTKHTSYLSYNDLVSCINSDCPLWLAGINIDNSDDMGHAVVARGYYYDSNTGSKTMYYMEPNSGFRASEFPSSGAITYTNGSSNYRNTGYIICNK